MLAEAADAEVEQVSFLSMQESLEPFVKTVKKANKTSVLAVCKSQLRCCACLEEGVKSSLVLCSLAETKLQLVKRNVRLWTQAPLQDRKRPGQRALTRVDFVAQKLQESMDEIVPHVFCPSCLRKYLMSTAVHMGELHKMFCPSCTGMLRRGAETMARPGDPFDMTGLGLDGIRDRSWGELMQPIDILSLTRVLGPLDLLYLCDVAFGMAKPLKLAHGLVKVLHGEGARHCPFCGHVCMHGGGCNAIVCDRCGLVFNWGRARLVYRRTI